MLRYELSCKVVESHTIREADKKKSLMKTTASRMSVMNKSRGIAREFGERLSSEREDKSNQTKYRGITSNINMPSTSFSRVDLIVDLGNPFLNFTVDAFMKIGAVAAGKVAAEETYHVLKRGNVSKHNFERSLKKMCKEGAYWGTVAGVYVGMEYGVEKIRGTRDWKNAMIGGALAGAVISAASNNSRDKIVADAITGGAIATAAEFLNYLS